MSTTKSAPPRSNDAMTEAEFLALPETLTKTELIDGMVVREPSPSVDHQTAVAGIMGRLLDWSRQRRPRPDVFSGPLDVRFAPGRILQPDVLVYLEPLVRPVAMPVERIPDLCIEIVSRRSERDRVEKRGFYADAGVRELWTVLPSARLLERWTGPGLGVREECRQRVATELLPDFEVDVNDVLGG